MAVPALTLSARAGKSDCAVTTRPFFVPPVNDLEGLSGTSVDIARLDERRGYCPYILSPSRSRAVMPPYSI